MSSVSTNPAVLAESKTAKKKKAKAEAAAQSPVVPELEAGRDHVAAEPSTNGTDTSGESPYMKELYK